MKKMLIPICLPVFLSSILVGCIAGSGNQKPEGSKSTDTSFPEAEPSTNETEPSSAPGETYAETSSETEKNRNPVYIATVTVYEDYSFADNIIMALARTPRKPTASA